ncbi:YdcF family protein [Alphaproteobacteria bacterium]|nr:YdcF family protein [Alphaproteobacteria bacterium]
MIILIIGLVNFKNSIPKATLNVNSGDAVIVLTGDKGRRIEKGYNLIDQTNFNKMFISGVGGSKTVLQKILGLDEIKVNCCIEFGYKAKNTYQNAIEVKTWALNNHINSIILVTTDLHMQRSLFLFQQITDLEIQAYPVAYKDKIIPIEKLFSEYIKFLISRIIFIKKYEN